MRRKVLFWGGVPVLAAVIGWFAYSLAAGGAFSRTGTTPSIELPPVTVIEECEIGQIVTATFHIANRGRGDLLIDQFRTNCACSGVERLARNGAHVNSVRIPPGRSENFRMRVSARGAIGAPMRNLVYFHTNDPAMPEATVEVLINRITGGLVAFPSSAVFGNVPVGQEAHRTLEVHDTAKLPRKIKALTTSSPDLVSVKLLEPHGPAQPVGVQVGRVQISLKATDPRQVDESVFIYLEGDTREPDRIPIVARIVPPIEVFPPSLVLPRQGADGPLYHGFCTCRSSTGNPLQLRLVEAPEDVVVQLPESTEPSQRIHIEWKPKKESPLATRRVVRLQGQVDGKYSSVEIPLTCR
jgi:hypothetical protein